MHYTKHIAPLSPALARQSAPQAAAAPLPRLGSEAILRGAKTVEIDHAGQRYLLRVTRENKLLLTK